MTSVDHLTVVLAERIMGWTAGPDRFSMGKRKWIPRWRFHPTNRMEDALVLLKHLAPDRYEMGCGENGVFWAKVHIACTTGAAHEASQAKALTFAIAGAVGIEVRS
jgi:hypothetical protein